MAPVQQHQPLAELSTNATITAATTIGQSHKVHDDKKEKAGAQAAATTAKYISPSDAMMSPTSKKLSEIKGRRFGSSSSASASLSARNMFARMREEKEREGARAKEGQT